MGIGDQEIKNIYLAVAVGAIRCAGEEMGKPVHGKKQRICFQTADEIIKFVAPKLPRVTKINTPVFEAAIEASELVLHKVTKEGIPRLHALLNLACFCMEELPLKKATWRKFNPIFTLCKESDATKDIIAGQRIFLRIESEIEILVAQRSMSL